MDELKNLATIRPGVRFHLTDEELIQNYLKRKLRREDLRHEVISKVNFYNYAPWELAEMYNVLTIHDCCYFFTLRMSASESTFSRIVKEGYWEKHGNKNNARDKNKTVGVKRVFHFTKGAPCICHNKNRLGNA